MKLKYIKKYILKPLGYGFEMLYIVGIVYSVCISFLTSCVGECQLELVAITIMSFMSLFVGFIFVDMSD